MKWMEALTQFWGEIDTPEFPSVVLGASITIMYRGSPAAC